VRWYHRDGSPFETDDPLEWAAEFESGDRHVGDDTVDGVRVSTVWLGIDHSFGGPVPLIFETMVFCGDHDGWMERYATEGQAARGHARALAAIREGREP
jgi:hypothetical protein